MKTEVPAERPSLPSLPRGQKVAPHSSLANLSTPAVSRRGFLKASALLLSTRTLLAQESVEDPLVQELRKEEDAQRLEMVDQSANVLRKNDSKLAMHWPKNTAVYAATVQTWPAWPDIHTDRPYFFQEIAKNFERNGATSLDGASRLLKNGWCWPYIPFTPQVPAFTAIEDVHQGWDKQQRDVKRFILVISGEGSRGSGDDYEDSYFLPLRRKLSEWTKAHPEALHVLDPKFVEKLKAEGDENSVEQYITSLKEERRFLDGGLYLKTVLQKQFDIPENKDHIRVLSYPRLKDLREVFKTWVAERQREGSELAVIYNGHGVLKKDVDDAAPQGLAEGALCINNQQKLLESHLKKLVAENAAEFDAVSILIDACHSGAFVA